MRLWIGTYPADGAGTPVGTGEGIWYAETDPATGRLVARQVAEVPAPSYLALSPDGATLYAVGETAPGMVLALAVGADGSLVERERITSGGSDPCHLLVHPSGRTLYVAQYSSGSLAAVPLSPDGGFAGGVGQIFEHSGIGPHERQAGPHVHSAVLVDDVVLALDLGTDELRRYRAGADGVLTVDEIAGRLPFGTGPRHAAVTRDGDLLVVGELSATLYLLGWDATTARVEPLDRLELAEPPALPAHVTVSPEGDRAFVGVRGPDEIAVVDVVGRRLVPRGTIPTPAWPRHHAVVDGCLLVAGERGHRVTVHAMVDGVPQAEVVDQLEIPSPTFILPRP
ncbi:lactonase family protein [Actinotalea sp. M2MS4P-6]|uniref:lactonase family protein n=1 Tax=Actinotalea sp. M2MS4P-6 TaxID=2983762 RepID=UPI0021E477D6|nr:lactonase family protein [Actinotalea sp. M2MS4P-6]MCV2395021.1 lactonase family protein [Actinotalea sp. M2MS4P-6]